MQEVIVHQMYGSENLGRYMRGEEFRGARPSDPKRPEGDYVLVGVYQERHPQDYGQPGHVHIYVVVWTKK